MVKNVTELDKELRTMAFKVALDFLHKHFAGLEIKREDDKKIVVGHYKKSGAPVELHITAKEFWDLFDADPRFRKPKWVKIVEVHFGMFEFQINPFKLVGEAACQSEETAPTLTLYAHQVTCPGCLKFITRARNNGIWKSIEIRNLERYGAKQQSLEDLRNC